MKKEKPFEDLQIKRKSLPDVLVGYRVYRDAKNFIIVQAPTAAAALTQSGIANAFKIERELVDDINIVEKPLKD